MISSSKTEQPPRFRTTNNYKNIKELRKNKTPLVNLPSLPRNHQSNKPNLQEPMKNKDGTYSILTIVNGVTNMNYNANPEQKYSDSTENRINKLRQTINECNKDKYALSEKQRITLIADSNIKGYVCNLKKTF